MPRSNSNRHRVVGARTPNWFWIERAVYDRFGHQIGPVGLAVYGAIAYHTNERRECFPSHEALARLIGRSARHVQRTITDLIDLGLVVCSEAAPRGGRGIVNTYYLPPIDSVGAENHDTGAGFGAGKHDTGAGFLGESKTQAPRKHDTRAEKAGACVVQVSAHLIESNENQERESLNEKRARADAHTRQADPNPPATGSHEQATLRLRQQYDAWRALYPRRDQASKAWAAWQVLNPAPAQVARIMAHTAGCAIGRQWLEDGGSFAPQPVRYLEEELYLGPIPPPAKPGNANGNGPATKADQPSARETRQQQEREREQDRKRRVAQARAQAGQERIDVLNLRHGEQIAAALPYLAASPRALARATAARVDAELLGEPLEPLPPAPSGGPVRTSGFVRLIDAALGSIPPPASPDGPLSRAGAGDPARPAGPSEPRQAQAEDEEAAHREVLRRQAAEIARKEASDD